MKIVGLTSLLPDVLRLSSPRPRLRHGRRLALLPRPNLTLKQCTLSFILLLALLPPLLTFPTVPPARNQLQSSPITCHLIFLSPSQFCSSFSPNEFLVAASNLSSSTATGPDKVAYPMLKHLPRSGMDFLLHIFNLSWSSHSFPSI